MFAGLRILTMLSLHRNPIVSDLYRTTTNILHLDIARRGCVEEIPEVATTDIQLGNQVQSRVSATKSTVQTAIANDTAQLSGQFTLTGDHAITECGLHKDASHSGNDIMLCRQVFAALNLRTGDVVTFVWKIQVSRSA